MFEGENCLKKMKLSRSIKVEHSVEHKDFLWNAFKIKND